MRWLNLCQKSLKNNQEYKEQGVKGPSGNTCTFESRGGGVKEERVFCHLNGQRDKTELARQ